jgi:hypothetical protein
MMNPATDSRCPQAEQSVGWAVHALEPAEEAEAAAHLPTCAECRELVRETEEVLAMLGSSDEMFEPPAELRAGLLARVAVTPQQPTLPLPSLRATAPPATAPPTQSDPTPPQPRPSAEPERPQEPVRATPDRLPSDPAADPLAPRRRWRLALVAAAVAVALGIGGVAIRTAVVGQQRPAETSQPQQLASFVSELQRPGGKAATLAPPNGAPVAAVVVVDGKRELVTVGMMPNPTSTHTYVLWGTGVGPPQPLGAFDVTEGTTGPRTVGPASAAENFTGYAISLEPGRSAPASPTQMVASGAVQA